MDRTQRRTRRGQRANPQGSDAAETPAGPRAEAQQVGEVPELERHGVHRDQELRLWEFVEVAQKLDEGKRLHASRIGTTTAVRMPSPAASIRR